jgi:hypothetical protein
MLVLREEFFEIAVDHFKDKVELFFLGLIADVVEAECQMVYCTMLGWGMSYLRMEIYLMAVEGIP